MLSLRRTLRFALQPPLPPAGSCGGWPSVRGMAAYGEIDVEVAGEPDPRTGYLVSITTIDEAVRRAILPRLAEALHAGDAQAIQPAALLPGFARRLEAHFDDRGPARLARIAWRPVPFLTFSFRPAMPDLVAITRQFEFSASHRLHCPELSEEENRALFGKCNNPNGHGHNYRLEVTVRVPLGNVPVFQTTDLERIVDAAIVQRFDHKHLNADCPEFASLNPSVEHIARVCHRLLEAPLRDAGAALASVTVRETEKTSATYPAPA